MRSDEVKEKDEHADQVIGMSEGSETLFRLVPSFELLVETLNEVVGDIVHEALDADVSGTTTKERIDRNLVGAETVRYNSGWPTISHSLV